MAKQEQNKGGRPSLFTEERVGKLEDAFRFDASVKQACAYARIPTDTFYEWIKKRDGFSDKTEEKKYQEFRERIAAAREFPLIWCKRTLVGAALKGNVKAAIEVLRRRDPDYKDKLEITDPPKSNTNPLKDRLLDLKNKKKWNTKSWQKKK